MKPHVQFVAVAMVILSMTEVASAQVVLATEHVDIDLKFATGAGWELGWHDETNDVEYATTGPVGATTWAYGWVGNNTLTPRSSNSAFNFVGVGSGQNFFHLPSSQIAGRLYLGVGAEETLPSAIASYANTDSRLDQNGGANNGPWIRLRLASMSGPTGGQLSVWSGNSSTMLQSDQGVNQVWIATSDGIAPSDSAYALAGSHIHFSYGFTVPGTYVVNFEASAFLGPGATNPTVSAITPYTFVVGVPEPSSMALVGVTVIGVAGTVRRRWAGKRG